LSQIGVSDATKARHSIINSVRNCSKRPMGFSSQLAWRWELGRVGSRA
jgi:hypothetical protein